MRKITALVALLMCVPFFASAQTADDLRAQVQSLIDQLKYIQGAGPTGTAPAINRPINPGGTMQGTGGINQGVPGLANQSGVTAVDSSSCPQIGRALKRGMSGDDVKRLQMFLARDASLYPDGTASGFYGSLTEAAVKRWQSKFNIVSSGTPSSTGWGVVGPRTAAAISLQCTIYGGGGSTGTAAPVGGFIQVSPISGNAPLTVNVQATVNTTNSCAGATYVLDWGDGSAPTAIPVSAGQCNQFAQTLTHTYRYGGTWQVSLSAGGHRTDATVVVYGGNQPTTPSTPVTPAPVSYGPLTVIPAVGGDPLAVTAGFSLGATCPSYTLSWGDGTGNVSQGPGCPGGQSPSLNHTYPSPGTYLITLTRGSQTDTASVIITN